MRVVCNGMTIAESDATVVVEGNHYFPAESVNWELLSRSRARSVCPWKGMASYYDIDAAGTVQPRAAWSYAHPFPWVRRIRGHVAFWGGVQVHG